MAEPSILEWRANPGPQTRFLALNCFEALYGGAAGGGKSDALLMGALRFVDRSGYRALLLRRTFPELQRSLIERSWRWYPLAGGKYSGDTKVWRFPSGAYVEFGHLEHDHDVHKYQSAEYQYIGFDEVTSFTEVQYRYMLSRARSTMGIPVQIRAATNPGGEGHDWVQLRWAPWLHPIDYDGVRAKPGEVLYYRNSEDGERYTARGPGALGRVFIPARVSDNPHLAEGDPEYIERLKGLDRVTRAQLLEGDWLARPARGAYFKRHWFEIVDAAPIEVAARCRHWDFAATIGGLDKKGKPTDPDYTVGCKVSRTWEGVWYIEHVIRFRGTPGDVKSCVANTAAAEGNQVRISIPQDPGQAGVAQAQDYTRALSGYTIHARRETGAKVDRAKPVSAQAEAGNMKIVRGAWNQTFLDELEAFPEGHDDQVDALSGAFADIQEGEIVELGDEPIIFGERRC